mgnify:CR=1 FL=1
MRRFALSLLIFPVLALLQMGFVAPQDDADAILQASKAKLQAVQDFSADFIIELANPAMDNPVTQEGSFKYKSGMYTLKLDGQEIYCDKNKTWVYISEVNEVEVSDYNPEDAQNIESIFQLYETNADARYDGVEKVGGTNCDKVFLAIKGGDLDYNQAYLYIERGSKLPRKVMLIDRRQTRTTYVFSDMKTNQGLSPAAFRFNEQEYPGVDVINL